MTDNNHRVIWTILAIAGFTLLLQPERPAGVEGPASGGLVAHVISSDADFNEAPATCR